MDAVRKFLSSKVKDVPDLNNSDDVRRVIEKVEVIDGVDTDAIHSQFNEIAEEKAAARRALAGDEKKELRKTPEVKVDKPLKRFPGFEDFQSPMEKPFAITSNEQRQDSTAGIPTKTSTKISSNVDSKESNPYLKNDNITAFID